MFGPQCQAESRGVIKNVILVGTIIMLVALVRHGFRCLSSSSVTTGTQWREDMSPILATENHRLHGRLRLHGRENALGSNAYCMKISWSCTLVEFSAQNLAHCQSRARELCESRGGRPGLPVPNEPYAGLCGC